MEKTLLSIQIDFNKAGKQADELEQIAKEIRQLAENDLESCMGTVASNWKGKSAAAYVTRGRKLEQEIGETAGELERIAKAIRQTAQNTYEAEKKAILAVETKSVS